MELILQLDRAVDPRERWQALQAALTISRERLDARDYPAALEAVERALAIDRDFLAAQSLRDRILSLSPAALASDARAVAEAPVPPAVPPAPAPVRPVPPAPPARMNAATTPTTAREPLVSAEGYAQFEQRAMRRRVDRRLEAARTAISLGRVKDAAAAIGEIAELDENVPDLPELTRQVQALRRGHDTATPVGRWLAAAAVFGAIVLGASWLHEAGGLSSRRLLSVGPLVSPPETFAATTVVASEPDVPPAGEPVATSGAAAVTPVPAPRDVVRADASDAVLRTAVPSPAERRAIDSPTVGPLPQPAVAVAAVASPPVQRMLPDGGPISPINTAAALPPPPAVAAPPPAAIATPPPVAVPIPDDESQVKQVLQRYRKAYEGLDARSARAVWPAVNEDALTRAFGALQSQSLTFDACDVRLRGDAAAATCRGSARYIPKVGSREPRTEPRIWTFALRKSGTDWTIESARAER